VYLLTKISNESMQRMAKDAAADFRRYVLGENFMLDSIVGMIYSNTRR